MKNQLIRTNAIPFQEALQQLEANLEQQLQLICTPRSPSLPPTNAPNEHNLSPEPIANASPNEASISISVEPNVNSNDDEWELVPLQMQ